VAVLALKFSGLRTTAIWRAPSAACKAVVPSQNKIILKNFSINIHEAVLQPIGAFVYCKRHAAATVAGRQNSEISTRRRRLRN